MATAPRAAPQLNGVGNKGASTRPAPVRNAVNKAGPTPRGPPPTSRAQPVKKKAASVAGETPAGGLATAYATLATRIANRVAEMAEDYTVVERPKAQEPEVREPVERRPPRKLEMRLGNSTGEQVAFSAPFLDNTLQKMLHLQNRMLLATAELSKAPGVEERIVKEHAAQSAELSRIIALICAEKARQGA